MGLGRKKGTRLVKPVIKEVSAVDYPAHQLPGWLVMKSVDAPDLTDEELADLLDDPDDPDYGTDEGDTPEGEDVGLIEDLTAQLATEKAARQALEEQVAKATGGTPAEQAAAAEEVEFAKAIAGLPEQAQAVLKAQREEVRKAREEAATEREARVSREYLDVAKSQFGATGSEAEQLATTLRAFDEKLPKDQADEAKRLIKAAKAQEAFAEQGGYGQVTEPGDGSAWSEVLAKAEEIRQASPDMSKAQSIQKARELNPDLARRHTLEQQGKA